MTTKEVLHHHDPIAAYHAAAEAIGYRENGGTNTDIPADIVKAALDAYDEICESLELPACPTWCDLTPGHKYDPISIPGDGFTREHSKRLDHRFAIEAREERTDDGVVTLDQPRIWIGVEPQEMTVEDARELARDLVTASLELTRIEAVQNA